MTTILEQIAAMRSPLEAMKPSVWQKATIVPGYDATTVRKDTCGAWIKWADYGNVNSRYGWEIDHIYPKTLGGTDSLNNLQALQWQNNRAKGDSLQSNYCAIVAQPA